MVIEFGECGDIRSARRTGIGVALALGFWFVASGCSRASGVSVPPTVARAGSEGGAGSVGGGDGAAVQDARVGASRVEPPAERDAQGGARAIVSAALSAVAERRGLEPKREVEGRWVGRDELLDVVDRSMSDSMPAEAMAANEAMLVGFGVVPQDFDYVRSVRALMSSELAGLYEPRDKAMYLAQDLGEAAMAATLTHELVHALQDQYFDLESRLEWSHDKGDQLSAIHALAEGDATLAMLDGAQPEIEGAGKSMDVAIRLQLEASTAAGEVPGILVRSAAASYSDGILFVEALKSRGGWQGVDAAWRSPPVSTEQILHLEKYDSREAPEMVPVPAAPGTRFGAPAYQDVMGEQGLRILFEEWVPRRTAVIAASDWAGDRLAVYSSGAEHAIGWRVRYESTAAAKRGGIVFTRGVLATGVGPSGLPETDSDDAERVWKAGWACRERQGLGPFGVLGSGRDLLVVVGPFARRSGEVEARATCSDAHLWATATLRSGQ